MNNTTAYENTPGNARLIGWARFPEYCIGDPSLPWVLHNHQQGVFVYSRTK